MGLTARIPLRRRDGSIRAHALLDAADFEWVSKWRWCKGNDDYVRRNGPGRTILLHRELLGLSPGDGLEGDHHNGDRLDNRRENLRVVTRAQNGQNRGAGCGYSLHRGVTWHKADRRWQAQVKLDGKNHYLGQFATEEEAARVAAEFRRERMPYSSREANAWA